MFAILARLQNIPTRLVSGYMGGTYNELGNFYTLNNLMHIHGLKVTLKRRAGLDMILHKLFLKLILLALTTYPQIVHNLKI